MSSSGKSVFGLELDLNAARYESVEYAYVGFDPSYTLDKLTEYAAANSRHFMVDMRKILVYYVTRGTKLDSEKAKLKTKESAYAELREIKDIYFIKDEKPKKREDISVARIVGVFPHLTGKLLASRIGRPVIPDYKLIPVGLQFASGASLIPKSPEFNHLFEAWVVWAKEFDNIINEEPNHAAVLKFAITMRNSRYVPEDVRIKLVGEFGV